MKEWVEWNVRAAQIQKVGCQKSQYHVSVYWFCYEPMQESEVTRTPTCNCEAVGVLLESPIEAGCVFSQSRSSASFEPALLPGLKFSTMVEEKSMRSLPVNSVPCRKMGSFDLRGLSFHTRSTRFCGGYTIFEVLAVTLLERTVAFSCAIMRASIPILQSLTRSWMDCE